MYISRRGPSQNWRAAVTLLFSITPTLPGLINNINPKIFVGNASFLFDVAWLYGVRLPINFISYISSDISHSSSRREACI